MAHVRKQIRDEVLVLLTGIPTVLSLTGERFFSLSKATKLPAIAVYTREEVVELLDMGGHQTRTLTFSVEVIAAAKAGLEDVLDSLATEIEARLVDEDSFSVQLQALDLTGTEFGYDSDGSKPNGRAVLSFDATYRTTTGAPETAL